MLLDEGHHLALLLHAQLGGDMLQRYSSGSVRYQHDLQCPALHVGQQAIHEVGGHSGRALKQRHEGVVVSSPEGTAHRKGMPHVGVLHGGWRYLHQLRSQQLACRASGAQCEQQPICHKLLHAAWHPFLIQLLEHSMALPELSCVPHLQSHTPVSLVCIHRQDVSHMLHCQVLADGLELLAGVLVVLGLDPLGLHQAQSQLQDVRGPHCGGHGQAGQPQVFFLKALTGAQAGLSKQHVLCTAAHVI
mmetsp:Transcript_3348/g.7311  ORF Transcript_3348/g.7311 Transcript_3348/m.7311 type:complete len:246 (-) Transcript_3348:766-1503(-)